MLHSSQQLTCPVEERVSQGGRQTGTTGGEPIFVVQGSPSTAAGIGKDSYLNAEGRYVLSDVTMTVGLRAGRGAQLLASRA